MVKANADFYLEMLERNLVILQKRLTRIDWTLSNVSNRFLRNISNHSADYTPLFRPDVDIAEEILWWTLGGLASTGVPQLESF